MCRLAIQYITISYGNPSTDIASLDSQSISASVSVPDLCDNTACMVNVRWSEPFVSCGGSVSHYMLSVTPPTPDCQSGSDDSGSEFISNETQYTLTVTANQRTDIQPQYQCH